MYTLIIISTFYCLNNTTIDKEESFKQTDYSSAVFRLDELLGGKGTLKKYFGGQQCVLEDVRAGHRKNEAITR